MTCSRVTLALKALCFLRISDTPKSISRFHFSSTLPSLPKLKQRSSGSASHRVNVLGTIPSTENKTNLNQKPLYDELQRYGVHESDYDITAIETLQRHSSTPVDTEPRPIVSKKRKSTEWTSKEPTLKEESGVIENWCSYLLLSGDSKKTYVGVTYDIRRRLRQHNGEIAGGAKAARAGRPWKLVCTVNGFHTRSEACQFEWRWKSTTAKVKTISQLDPVVAESPLVTRRRATMTEVLAENVDWSSLDVQWHDR